MKLLLIFLFLVTPTFAQRRPAAPKPKPAPKAAEVYDPDKLPPGEVACGRLSSTKSAPCECMKHRVKIRDEQQAKCLELVGRKARIECSLKINPCPAVIDQEQSWTATDEQGAPMPAQCRRSCKLARCECCHS